MMFEAFNPAVRELHPSKMNDPPKVSEAIGILETIELRGLPLSESTSEPQKLLDKFSAK